MNRLLLAVALGLTALTTAPAAAPAPAEPAPDPLAVKVERNVLYDTIDKQDLLLDIAMPKDGGPHPCVVIFHGGAWQGGSRRDISVGGKDKNGKLIPSILEDVAARGYVAVAPSYRLAPKYQFPAQIQDARAAIRFLRANAKAYNIDPDRIAAAGFSAGGHLALLLGLADKV